MRSDNTYLRLILVLSLAGVLVSGWLLSIHIRFSTGQAMLTESCYVPGFGSSEGCANVAVSNFSAPLGIPVAAVAMGYYFALLVLVFWAMRNFQAASETLYTGFFLSTLAVVVTVVMFCLSHFVIKSFCIGCSILWLINLLVWPCFVAHLKLRWGNAVAANLELVRHKNLNLRKDRILTSFAVGLVCLVVFSVVGVAAKSLQRSENHREGEPSIISEYQSAPQMFLPKDAFGGPTAKGAVGPDQHPVMDIVEFADFECPACRMEAQFLKPFVMKHKDEVRLTFRNFPLDGSCNPFTPNGPHHSACLPARVGICAAGQGKFWPMHDEIYDHQDELSASTLDDLEAKVGLDRPALEACLKDQATENHLQKDMQWGDLIQLESTPTLIINGRRMAGARPPSDMEALLNYLRKAR
jgi:protein-disulfide isomerase/uncharacterized membrane protein